MDNGCIEIGNINTQASAEAIRKLKSILDQHGIFHIIDGVMFNHPDKQVAQLQAIDPGRTREVSKKRDELKQQYRELIVPDLYNLNFMSIFSFDSKEADFLSFLIYGEN